MKKRTRFPFKPSLQLLLVAAIAITALAALLFRLVLTAPALHPSEQTLPTVRASLSTLWNAPVEAPIHIARALVALVTPETGVGLSRFPSVLLGVLTVLLVYFVLKRWYKYRLAFFGTALFISSAWLLHTARLATSDVVYALAAACILALIALWHQADRKRWLLYATAFITAGLLYVPGMLWLVLGVFAFEYRNVWQTLKTHRLHAALSALLGLTVSVPLIHSLISNWRLYQDYLGIPANLPDIDEFGKNVIQTWQYLFVGGSTDPLYNVGGLPILNMLVSLAFVVGIYLYGRHPRAIRTQQLAFLWFIGTVLIALGSVSNAFLLPIVFVLAVGGIGYLLHLWLKVFPRNPYARNFGIGMVALVVLLAISYDARNYFIAWPNNPETRAVFEQRQ